MESGLEDRNNLDIPDASVARAIVSMESGLEDRNNLIHGGRLATSQNEVSMESGLEDRNNIILNKGEK